ncbi:uracil-DNA glycosylase [Variovorax sp. VNK109]|jgi:uracil-DNA glycosylase family 4|uniref:uracil-DNA glycosylase n=1 Tax=Variovorax sp. VNK109 TaxID=3400919 RepID=UPI003C070458
MSLELDERQRAMLAEMNVHVWMPPAVAPAEVLTQVAAPAVSTRAPRQDGPPAAAPASVPAPVTARITGDRPAGIARMSWVELQDAVAGCQACKLCHSRRNTVFGVGQPPAVEGAAPQADWLIVGEAPGENEDLQGEPFVGQAGKLLDNMLTAIGLSRHENVFIVNVLKCRPPGNRNPEPEEVAQCEPFLRRQVELLQPKIILAMGRFAVQSLLQTQDAIGRLRGRVHQYHGVPVVVSYHPAYLLRNLPDKAKAWDDLCLAMDTVALNSPAG